MNSYLLGIDAVTGATRTVARISDVLGSRKRVKTLSEVLGGEPEPVTTTAIVPAKTNSITTFLRDIGATVKDVPDSVGTPVGAVLGAVLWKEHRVLGALGGASLGRNVPALLNSGTRGMALRNLATTGGGVAGQLLFPSLPGIGYLLGMLAGGAAAYYGDLK